MRFFFWRTMQYARRGPWKGPQDEDVVCLGVARGRRTTTIANTTSDLSLQPTDFVVSAVCLLSGYRDVFLLRYHSSATTHYHRRPNYDAVPITLSVYVSWYKVVHFGHKALRRGLAPLGLTPPCRERRSRGQELRRESQRGRVLGRVTLHRSSSLMLLIVLRIPIA